MKLFGYGKFLEKFKELKMILEINNFNVKLPKIVVVGEQSCGKSSLIESIVGKTFLPKGNGMVTRRPLLINLICDSGITEEYGMIGNQNREKYYDFMKFKMEIDKVMETTCKTMEVSKEELVINIYSPNVLNLTLLDLPGLTRVAVLGQNKDIPEKTRYLAKKYISDENSLVLLVISGEQDVATSETLRLVEELSIDREGARTLGVITKVDRSSDTKEILKILNGHKVYLKLGYIPVVNITEEDLMKGIKTHEEKLKWEENFFMNDDNLMEKKDLCGVGYLCKVLNRFLMIRINNYLSVLKVSLDQKLNTLNKELEKVNSVIGNSENCVSKCMEMVANICEEYVENYSKILYGKFHSIYEDESENNSFQADLYGQKLELNRSEKKYYKIVPHVQITTLSSNLEKLEKKERNNFQVTNKEERFLEEKNFKKRESSNEEPRFLREKNFKKTNTSIGFEGGARIYHILQKNFSKALLNLDLSHVLSKDKVNMIFERSRGTKNSLLWIQKVIEFLLSLSVEEFRSLCLDTVETCYQELLKISSYSFSLSFSSSESLRSKILCFSEKYIFELKKTTITMVNTLVDIEKNYFNADHPDLENINMWLPHPCIELTSSQPLSPLNTSSARIEQIFSKYITIVKTKLCDAVQKTIFHCLIERSKRCLVSKLVCEIFSSTTDFCVFFKEDVYSINLRKNLVEEVKKIKGAYKIVEDLLLSCSLYM